MSRSPSAAAPIRGHIPALDGIRAVAIVAVFAYHAVRVEHADSVLSRALVHVASAGWMGVDLFFVLSGFLITGILLDTRGTEGYYRTFALRRALRILPLYYATLLALLVGIRLLPGAAGAGADALGNVQGWYWTHLVNVLVGGSGFDAAPLMTGHLWSLAVEEQFYLVWPFVVALCPAARLRRVCVALAVVALATRVGLVLGGARMEWAYVLPVARLDALAVGAWLAATVRMPGGVDGLRARAGLVGATAAVVLGGVVLAEGSLRWPSPWMQTLGYTAVALLAGAGLAAVLTTPSGSWPARLLTCAPLRHVGQRSYALYVLHYPLIALAALADISGETFVRLTGTQGAGLILWLVALFAATYVLATITWHAIERPALALKDRIAGRPAAPAGAAPADRAPLAATLRDAA